MPKYETRKQLFHIPDLVQVFPKKLVGQTSHLYDSR